MRCMRLRLRKVYTRAYAQIMQHTHTHKAVTGRAKATKLLARRRQSNNSVSQISVSLENPDKKSLNNRHFYVSQMLGSNKSFYSNLKTISGF